MIPAAVTLSKEGTPLTITASDVAYLGEKRISVTEAAGIKLEPGVAYKGTITFGIALAE